MGTVRAGPVKRAPTPRYPTRMEVADDPELLRKHVPGAWLHNRELAGALSIALAAGPACVVPYLFDDGSSGCVTIIPPVYLTEEQAMRAITEDMLQAGVALSTDPQILSGYQLPVAIDAADPALDVAVEFVSREDCLALGSGGASGCEFGYSGFSSLAENLEQQVAASDTSVHFEAFWDPAYPDEEESISLLREQVRSFVEWLQGEGII